MSRLAGSICILGGGLWLRWLCLQERRRRRAVLSGLLFFLRRLTEEIRMSRTALPVLLQELAKEAGADIGTFLACVTAGLEGGETLQRSWEGAEGTLAVTDSVAVILDELGKSLRGDEEAVRKAISAAEQKLARELETMDAAQKLEERQLTAISLSGAMLLIILLI